MVALDKMVLPEIGRPEKGNLKVDSDDIAISNNGGKGVLLIK